MASLSEIVEFCDSELRIAEIPDYPQALNGLQLANRSGEVTRIVAAVDACLPVIRESVVRQGNLLVVHHGMFWSGAQRIVDAQFEKIRVAMEGDLAIYSCHIPLDVHPGLGNNAMLMKSLELSAEINPFFDWKGIQLGLRADGVGVNRDELLERVKSATGADALICPGGPEKIESLGVITGGAGGEVLAVGETGIDTFITGEGPHWSYTAAEELGMNVIYAGHYATETFGVKSLAGELCDRLEGELSWEFVDHPTGL